jgi:hypothetical protein
MVRTIGSVWQQSPIADNRMMHIADGGVDTGEICGRS